MPAPLGGLRSLEALSKGGTPVVALFSRADGGARPSKKEKAAARALFEERGTPSLLLASGGPGVARERGLLSGRSIAAVYPLWLGERDFVAHWAQFVTSFAGLLKLSRAAEAGLEKALRAGTLEPIDPQELPLEGRADGGGEASAVSLLVVLDAEGQPTPQSMAVAVAAFRATGMPVVLWRDESEEQDEDGAEASEEEILTWEEEAQGAAAERVEKGEPPVAIYPAWAADPTVFELIGD